MTSIAPTSAAGRRGFTVAEILMAVAVFAVVTAFVTPCLVWIMRYSRGGSQQAEFTMLARQSELTIGRHIRDGRAVGVISNTVTIRTTSNTVASVFYQDMDNNPATLSNNVLRFDPDIDVANNEETICGYVSAIPGEPMVTNVDLSPMAVRFRYHVGEGSNTAYSSNYSSSPGFQGVEVRFSATPRQTMNWYD